MADDVTSSNDAIKSAAAAESTALLQKHLAAALAAEAADPGDVPAADATPAEPKTEPADKSAKRERGPDGKFLPTDAPKAAAPAAEKKPDPAAKDTPAPADEKLSNSLATARRLAKEGKLEDAIAVALKPIGIDLDKIPSTAFASLRKESRERREAIQKDAEQVAKDRLEVQQFAQQVAPMFAALQALEAEDYDAFVNLATRGRVASISEFNKKAIAKLHGSAPPDAATQRRIAELERVAREALARSQQLEQQAAQRERAPVIDPEKQRAYKETVLREELELLDDDELATLAEDESFVDEVFRVKQKHWNGQSTLETDDAAAIAYKQWKKKQEAQASGDPGAIPGSSRVRSAVSARSPSGARLPARQVGKPATNINSQEAAEAAPSPKLEGKALMDYWVRRAKSDLAKESA